MKNKVFALILISSSLSFAQTHEVVLRSSGTDSYTALAREGEIIKLTAYEKAKTALEANLDSACKDISGALKPESLSETLDNCDINLLSQSQNQAVCTFSGKAICLISE